MTLSKVFVTEDQKDFLELIIHTDAANSIGGAKGELGNAVQWCIDACMRIEEVYGVDACYVSFNDIRLPENDPAQTSIEPTADRELLGQESPNKVTVLLEHDQEGNLIV